MATTKPEQWKTVERVVAPGTVHRLDIWPRPFFPGCRREPADRQVISLPVSYDFLPFYYQFTLNTENELQFLTKVTGCFG